MRSACGREVVIVAAARTPIGRAGPGGHYAGTHPNDLLGHCFRAVVERAGVDPAHVEDVVAGCVQPYGEQGLNVARNAWLQAGLPVTTPATTVDHEQPVNLAAALIAAGAADVAIGAGVEHMGRVPLGIGFKWADEIGSPWPPALTERFNLVPRAESAKRLAEGAGLSRADLDDVAARSRARAHAAAREGRFDAETVPVATSGGLRSADEGGAATGHAAPPADGAAAVLLMERERARRLGIRPLARVAGQAAAGGDPVIGLGGPIEATRRLLGTGTGVAAIDLAEVDESFAAVVAAWLREPGADPGRVNVNGGAIALGHPLGANGARMVVTLVHELGRSGARLGLVAAGSTGGLGHATLLERAES